MTRRCLSRSAAGGATGPTPASAAVAASRCSQSSSSASAASPSCPASCATHTPCAHTCATALLRAGTSLIDVRDFLGHASIKTTSIYLSSGPERQEAAVIAREQGRSTLDQDRDAA